MALVALALGLLLERPPLEQINVTPQAVLWGVASCLPLLAALMLAVRWPVGPLSELERISDQFIVPMFRRCSLLELAIVAILAGIGEEMLFRGVVQEAIAHRFGPAVGLIAASLLFGLAHPITHTYAVLAGLIGFYLGGLWMWSDNLLPPILCHACYDFAALVYLVRRGQQRQT